MTNLELLTFAVPGSQAVEFVHSVIGRRQVAAYVVIGDSPALRDSCYS
ncbi:MAG: hypothetical protein OXG60_00760 [Chloroflexi bacterium]|nr:hypothetical protein [Chloroflexota bacterium]